MMLKIENKNYIKVTLRAHLYILLIFCFQNKFFYIKIKIRFTNYIFFQRKV